MEQTLTTLHNFQRTGKEILRAKFCQDYGHEYEGINSPKVLVFEGGYYAEIEIEKNEADGDSVIYHLAIHNKSWTLFSVEDVARLLWNKVAKQNQTMNGELAELDMKIQMDEICARNNINHITEDEIIMLTGVDKEIAMILFNEYGQQF